jgi:glycosyltransferase involved in cell wall biosynthesis
MLPRFSVIIPNFNNGITLSRAIESVLAQTFAAHEIIVVDDGSTDDSRAVAESYGERVRYFWQNNQGVSAARNYGVEMATGDWLAFLDADDEYYPNRLEAHAHWIHDEPDLDFLLGDQESRTPDGELIETFIAKSQSGRAILNNHSGADRISLSAGDFENLISDGFTEIRTISVPKKRFVSLGGFASKLKVGEDLHFFVRLFAVSQKGGVVPEVLSIYYIYPSSVLRKDPLLAMRNFVDAIEILERDVSSAPAGIRRGVRQKCRASRLSLSYALLRANKKGAAFLNIVPNFLKAPSLATMRDVASICRGFPSEVKFNGIRNEPVGKMPAN